MVEETADLEATLGIRARLREGVLAADLGLVLDGHGPALVLAPAEVDGVVHPYRGVGERMSLGIEHAAGDRLRRPTEPQLEELGQTSSPFASCAGV
jgi:hypothetical protein